MIRKLIIIMSVILCLSAHFTSQIHAEGMTTEINEEVAVPLANAIEQIAANEPVECKMAIARILIKNSQDAAGKQLLLTNYKQAKSQIDQFPEETILAVKGALTGLNPVEKATGFSRELPTNKNTMAKIGSFYFYN
ncbi:hypothetical protein ACPV3A_07790 [Paenibacillus sp. Dod16]|uniref:hypothetical protein n=1 Tax=Paenibacillus sp. Dod16 TaxID=3416392 RepID=UPI003CF33D78